MHEQHPTPGSEELTPLP